MSASAEAIARGAVTEWASARGYWLVSHSTASVTPNERLGIGQPTRVSPLLTGAASVEAYGRVHLGMSWCRVMVWALVHEIIGGDFSAQVLRACAAFYDADLFVKLDAMQADGDPLGELLMVALQAWPQLADDDPGKVEGVEKAARWLRRIAECFRSLLRQERLKEFGDREAERIHGRSFDLIIMDDLVEGQEPDERLYEDGALRYRVDASVGYTVTFGGQAVTLREGEYTAQQIADQLDASDLAGAFSADGDTVTFAPDHEGSLRSVAAQLAQESSAPRQRVRRRHDDPPAHIGRNLARRLGRVGRRRSTTHHEQIATT